MQSGPEEHAKGQGWTMSFQRAPRIERGARGGGGAKAGKKKQNIQQRDKDSARGKAKCSGKSSAQKNFKEVRLAQQSGVKKARRSRRKVFARAQASGRREQSNPGGAGWQ